ncbi:ECF sigma factor [Bordetella ansorpii]|uniref:ECF sigma factor n=1 Tax=Bordetella ansorpii TaxID=288768 RepID=A0A157QJV5_9BORD|nr:RNA polymerase sigma factor [Bordetella ansorpii]SAI46173.1 ECF sigma factor [Bordetella ansorpii]
MSDASALLLDYLTRRYGDLKLRLGRLLRNSDLAGDALQDTWLRLKTQDKSATVIQSPGAYLVRMAAHAAVDIQRRQGQALSLEEVNELFDLADTAPGPAQLASDRSDLAELTGWLNRLPERQREVIVLVRWEGLPQKEVAKRLGVSLRTVELDLQRAHEYLDKRMGIHG